jgi:hypothetical protein
MTRRFLAAFCLVILCVILMAGLWPFHAPKNEVKWLNHSNGLSFGKYGSAVSAGVLKSDSRQAIGSCSLEIWLEPRLVDSKGTVLGFYWPEGRVVPFAIRQYQSGLVLESATEDNAKSTIAVYVDKIFKHPGPVLVTITSNLTDTTVYADGSLLRKFPDFRISRQDLTGRLVVGNSPVAANAWSGQFLGLAIYDRELTVHEVSQHLANWTQSEHPDEARNDDPAALYLFNEGNGNVVRNQVDSTAGLVIPERFFVLHEQFLERPWDEYRPGWRYWKNVGINIAGFVPLGFFFCAHFSSLRNSNGAVGKTTALGFLVSLTIEVLQALLPTRDSGMTDLITNTLGTAIGVMMFRYNPFRAILAQKGFYIEKSNLSAVASSSVKQYARTCTGPCFRLVQPFFLACLGTRARGRAYSTGESKKYALNLSDQQQEFNFEKSDRPSESV